MSSKAEVFKKNLIVTTPPQLSAEDVAAIRMRHSQPPTRSTPMANKTSPNGRPAHYGTMPPDGFDSPRRHHDSAGRQTRETSADSGLFSTSLPYSWTDSYLDESPAEMRQRWLNKQTFGPVLQSEGYSTTVSTPYVYRNPESVWGRQEGNSPMQMESDADNRRVAKPLSFSSQASTAFAPAQVGKRQIVRTRQPKGPQNVSASQQQAMDSASFAEPPSPHQSRPATDSRRSNKDELEPSASMELPRTDSKRSLGRGIARGRPMRAIFEDEDDFFQ